jgi:SAM-dependent methyltransferase
MLKMSKSPYENPDFAKSYARNQVDISKNHYELLVTHPATLQFLDRSVDRVLDYGCGGGVFTAAMVMSGRELMNPSLEAVGTDASSQMLRYTAIAESLTEGVSFQPWDASIGGSALQNRSFDRVFAKLVLNYVSNKDLREAVLPRLRDCLKDDGLLVAVLPNPLREAGYSNAKNNAMNEMTVNVGNFSTDTSTQTYHHTYETVIEAANHAGFAYGNVLGLPQVRFEPYKRQLMKIAHPMPMALATLDAARRWIYVFGATKASVDNFDNAVSRFENWRTHVYPEIADIASLLVTDQNNPDIDLPIDVPHDALYSYRDASDPRSEKLVTIKGNAAEHMTPKQKIKLAKRLAASGLRGAVSVDDFLVNI